MKVYALIGGWNYEGRDVPVGIFSTKKRAESGKKYAYSGYDFLDIYECTVDKLTPVKIEDES